MPGRTRDDSESELRDSLLQAVAKAPAQRPAGREDGASHVKPGDILAKKYRVERVLGEGGMGVVVAAHHLLLDEKVALKFLLPKGAANAEAIRRFAREARVAAKIKSEHVARVIDVGELESGAPYIVMEYLDGSDLAAWLAGHGRVSAQQAVGFVLQACEALAEAHVLGIVHRDLKPGNLFLARRPGGPAIVKVLDFGISKSSLLITGSELTRTSEIMGSPLYMSPEQMQSSKTVDVRSDIWALGIVLYEMLGGSPPFHGATMPELVVAVRERTQDPLHSVRSDLPPGLEVVVDRCLAKNPAARYPNVLELAVALAPFGPPRSDVSVERISQVLGAREDAPESPAVIVPHAQGLAVSPVAHTATSTTSEPVSSEYPRILPSEPRARRLGRATLARSVGVIVVVGVAGAFAARSVLSRAPRADESGPTLPRPIEPSPPTPSYAQVPATAAAMSSATASSAPSLVTQPETPRLGPPRPRHSVSTATQSGPPPAASVANCNPPYTIDSAGLRHYKRECNN